jgi:hypothetical protein
MYRATRDPRLSQRLRLIGILKGRDKIALLEVSMWQKTHIYIQVHLRSSMKADLLYKEKK